MDQQTPKKKTFDDVKEEMRNGDFGEMHTAIGEYCADFYEGAIGRGSNPKTVWEESFDVAKIQLRLLFDKDTGELKDFAKFYDAKAQYPALKQAIVDHMAPIRDRLVAASVAAALAPREPALSIG